MEDERYLEKIYKLSKILGTVSDEANENQGMFKYNFYKVHGLELL